MYIDGNYKMAENVALRIFITLIFISICEGSKLLVILMDGYRWDYFNQPGVQLPGFQRMFEEGVRAEYLIPSFPSLSYPNYYSLMTGLHVESHGMVSNSMYSKEHNETFLGGTNPEQYHPHWWNEAEPLWVTAEKNGRKSYMFYWLGCDVEIKGVRPTFCEMYRLCLIPEFQYSIKSTLELLKNDTADLIGILIDGPDRYGHDYGAKSNKLNQLLKEVDTELNYLLGNLSSEGLDSDLNIMIFSDHGMANVTKIVDFRNLLSLDDIEIYVPEVTMINIWPKYGKVEKVYNDLVALQKPNVKIYKKQDLPDRYLYRHRLIPPVIIIPDAGYLMCTDKDPEICSKDKYRGYHGYDNVEEDMRAIFIARGPAFKKNYVTKPIANIELYQIMCSILGIPAQPHNGTWEIVEHMMAPSSFSSWQYWNIFLVLLSSIFLSVFVLNIVLYRDL